MSEYKRSRARRFLNLIVFRLIPLILLIAMLWSGIGVARAVIQRVNEQANVTQRLPQYAGTVTAAAATLVTYTPTSTATATNTPTDTATAPPSATPSPAATATSTATVTATSTSTPTDMPTVLPTDTAMPVVVAQVFATNTPRAAVITLPAVNTVAPAATETPTVTWTPLPSATAEPDMAPTATMAAVQDATPRPLPTIRYLGDPDPNRVDVTAVPTRVPIVDRQYDLFNVLLLGSDGEITGDGFVRTDTMIVVSINRDTGSVAMLSLPRDLFVYIPEWGMQRLNLAYARGESGGWNDGTFELLRQTILYNFGINVHYYALIDLSGFRQVIDTLGGVDVAVDCAIEDLPLIGADVPAAARRINEDGYYVLDVGYYTLNGGEALWYARSRYNSTDFDRGRRQQQLLRAIWRQARDTGLLARLPELWGLSTEIIKTNLAFEDVLGLLPFALNLNPALIENFALVRTYHTTPWQTPDGDFVQLPVYETLRPLLEDFYRPPTQSQITAEGASISVYNGTGNANWDRVAAERLAWDGLLAVASGSADRTDYSDTVLIDYTGQSKGSSRGAIASVLNVKPENIVVSPDPNRSADFEVILGSSYNSCTFAVLPPTG